MTNPNDTSTPAMSAETVPSEALKPTVANPFLPGGLGTRLLLAIHAYRKEYVYTTDDVEHLQTEWEEVLLEDFVAGIGGDESFGEIVREATLSASHLAKEGGEAGAVEVYGPYGWLVKPIGLAEDEWSLESDPAGDEEHAVSVALYALEPQKLGVTVPISGNLEKPLSIDWHSVFEDIGLARDLIKEAKKTGGDEAADNLDAAEHWLDQVEKALSPQPSPALAKGGDAVREALRKIATMPWRSNSTVEMQSIARAALSTLMEGPASQTEGMGGGALRDTIARAITGMGQEEFKEWAANHSTYPNAYKSTVDRVFTQTDRIIAALTPPETAEAVPDEAEPDTVAQGVELWRCVHLGGERDFWTSDYKQAENCASTGRYTVLRHVINPDPEAASLRQDFDSLKRTYLAEVDRSSQIWAEKEAAERKLADAVKALETASKLISDVRGAWWYARNEAKGGHLSRIWDRLVAADAAARSASSQGGE